jgi:hypothetical protein
MKLKSRPFPLFYLIVFLLTSFTTWSCKDEDEKPEPPTITSFSPLSGMPGATVTITGSNFSTTSTDNTVKFNGTTTSVVSATATQLTVIIPVAATSGKITITRDGVTATSQQDFTVLEHSITNFAPASGVVGTSIIVNGSNFSIVPAENIVKINGADALVTEATANQLTVLLPATATTGKITITLNGKTITSTEDFVIPPPTITTYFPAVAAVGRLVVISGTNFSTVSTGNIVKFNGTAAEVTEASSTQLTVTIPEGATTGAVSVRVGPHTATSANNFEICSGSAEIVISDVVIVTNSATSYSVSFTVTNVGSLEADQNKFVMQNYASADAAYSGGDVAASGYTLSGGILTPGHSHRFLNYTCSISGGNTTSQPYLIMTFSSSGAVPECNTANNVIIKPFNP